MTIKPGRNYSFTFSTRLAAGVRTVAVPFAAIKHTLKDKKIYLTMDTTKDALKAAPGVKYDKERTSWVPEGAH